MALLCANCVYATMVVLVRHATGVVACADRRVIDRTAETVEDSFIKLIRLRNDMLMTGAGRPTVVSYNGTLVGYDFFGSAKQIAQEMQTAEISDLATNIFEKSRQSHMKYQSDSRFPFTDRFERSHFNALLVYLTDAGVPRFYSYGYKVENFWTTRYGITALRRNL
jgi:hypothetical protein